MHLLVIFFSGLLGYAVGFEVNTRYTSGNARQDIKYMM